MIVEFTIKRNANLTEQQEEALVKLVGRPLERKKDGSLRLWETYRAPIGPLLDITAGFEIEKRVEPHHIEQVAQRLRAIERKVVQYSQDQQYNDVVNVHVADVGLMKVRHVEYQLDCCTEELQDWLDRGWRIIAVCPQPDQRRPDYILGIDERPE